uniref:Uncharacterized protein n=1 Tax=Oryza barthii TaxID=65489 RepID=A0A0D3HTQ7_9ORYZ
MVEKRRRSPHPLLSPLPLPPRRFASRRCHRSRPPAAVSWAPGTAGGGDLDLDLSLGCFNVELRPGRVEAGDALTIGGWHQHQIQAAVAQIERRGVI